MSSNTDFFAQMAEAFSKDSLDYDHSLNPKAMTEAQRGNVLNLNLEHHAGTPLADSVAQICQGVIGSLIAKEGGLENLLKSRMSPDDAWLELKRDLEAHKRFMKAELMAELSGVIEEYVEERLTPFSAADELRDRVMRFSLQERPQHSQLVGFPADQLREEERE